MTKEQLAQAGLELREWKHEPVHEGRPEREKWGPGPWQNEPDRVEWRKPGSPLPRLVVRGPMGSWCGYVGLPPGHPLHGKGWGAPEVEALQIHGGVTYGEACAGDICHVPAPGEPDHVWWLGFDCAHLGDLSPGLNATIRKVGTGRPYGTGETYRDLAFIVAEVEELAAQVEQ